MVFLATILLSLAPPEGQKKFDPSAEGAIKCAIALDNRVSAGTRAHGPNYVAVHEDRKTFPDSIRYIFVVKKNKADKVYKIFDVSTTGSSYILQNSSSARIHSGRVEFLEPPLGGLAAQELLAKSVLAAIHRGFNKQLAGVPSRGTCHFAG